MAENDTATDNPNTENQSTLHAIDDKFFWDIYNRPANVAGFLKDFLPSNIYQTLDTNVLTVDKKSYLSEAYREHFTDLVVQTRLKGNPKQPAFVYFLLEHKSYSPVRPAFQLLRYMVEQWYDLEKQGLPGNTLPPIFPIIVYHGDTRWTHGEYFHDIVNLPHDDMKPYVPNFKYLAPAIIMHESKIRLGLLTWGLIPFWAKEKKGTGHINARMETLDQKPGFQASFRKRRCLIIANGYYEWKADPGKGHKKTKYLFELPSREPFAFAGLWDTWRKDYHGGAIITRDAVGEIRDIHHRMPCVLKTEAYQAWLDPANQDVHGLMDLLRDACVTNFHRNTM